MPASALFVLKKEKSIKQNRTNFLICYFLKNFLSAKESEVKNNVIDSVALRRFRRM